MYWLKSGNEVATCEHTTTKSSATSAVMNSSKSVKRMSAGQVHLRRRDDLLVSTSMCGNAIPPDNIVVCLGFVLLHGNGVSEPDRIRDMVSSAATWTATRDSPSCLTRMIILLLISDDNNMLAATDSYASWGYFDYRMAGEGFDEGYQSVPVKLENQFGTQAWIFQVPADMTDADKD